MYFYHRCNGHTAIAWLSSLLFGFQALWLGTCGPDYQTTKKRVEVIDFVAKYNKNEQRAKKAERRDRKAYLETRMNALMEEREITNNSTLVEEEIQQIVKELNALQTNTSLIHREGQKVVIPPHVNTTSWAHRPPNDTNFAPYKDWAEKQRRKKTRIRTAVSEEERQFWELYYQEDLSLLHFYFLHRCLYENWRRNREIGKKLMRRIKKFPRHKRITR